MFAAKRGGRSGNGSARFISLWPCLTLLSRPFYCCIYTCICFLFSSHAAPLPSCMCPPSFPIHVQPRLPHSRSPSPELHEHDTTRISCLTNIKCFALSLAAQRRFSKVRISIPFGTFSPRVISCLIFFFPSRDAAALGGCWRTRAPCLSTLAIILWPIWARPLRLWPGQASQRRKRTSNGQKKNTCAHQMCFSPLRSFLKASFSSFVLQGYDCV